MVSALLGGRSRTAGFRLNLHLPASPRRHRTEHAHSRDQREAATRAFQAAGDRIVDSLRRLSFDDLVDRIGDPVRLDGNGTGRTSFFLIVDRIDDTTVRILVQGVRPHGWMGLGSEVYLSGFRCTPDGHTCSLGVCERHDMSLDARAARRHVA